MTQRKESDTVQILSGVFEGFTTGTPIALLIPNEDQRSKDYSHLAEAFRPSHADFTFHAKYGRRDHRGGGRSSARETAARVAAGALAKLLLATQNIRIQAWVSQVGDLKLDKMCTVRPETWQRWHGPQTGSTMFLSPGEQVSVENLPDGIVTLSGNDA